MSMDAIFELSVAFAIVTGTGAGILSLLSWEIFRRSPLGRAIFVLSMTMSLFILYHVLLLSFRTHPTVVKAVESVAYTGVVVFIGAMVISQRRLRKRADGGETP